MEHPHDIVPSDPLDSGSTPPMFEDFEEIAQPSNSGGSARSDPSDGLEAVHDVQVKVQAVLGRTRMPIGNLLQLTSGAVLELDRRVGEPVDIFVNDRLIARGEVVLIDGALGVSLTEIVRAER
jgi:flagellar motor switch protein FliN/FliY